MPRAELPGASRGQVEMREIGKNSRLLEALPLAPDGAHIHPRGLADSVVRFAGSRMRCRTIRRSCFV